MFALDDVKPPHHQLDDCIDESQETDMFPLARLVQGHPQAKKRPKSIHLKPVAFVRFNMRSGKAKGVTIKALLDSGGAESLATEQYAKKLKIRKTAGKPKTWATPAGDMTTNQKCKTQFTFPELHSDRTLEWDFHVTPTLGAHGMIIGRDILEFLGIDIQFSDQTTQWDHASMPFKDQEAGLADFFVEEPEAVEDANERLKKILDAKYDKADLEAVCRDQPELNQAERDLSLIHI